jgi:hypothetical protein
MVKTYAKCRPGLISQQWVGTSTPRGKQLFPVVGELAGQRVSGALV